MDLSERAIDLLENNDPQLLSIVQADKQKSLLVNFQGNQVFPVVHGYLPDPDFFHLAHGLMDDAKRFLGCDNPMALQSKKIC